MQQWKKIPLMTTAHTFRLSKYFWKFVFFDSVHIYILICIFQKCIFTKMKKKFPLMAAAHTFRLSKYFQTVWKRCAVSTACFTTWPPHSVMKGLSFAVSIVTDDEDATKVQTFVSSPTTSGRWTIHQSLLCSVYSIQWHSFGKSWDKTICNASIKFTKNLQICHQSTSI